MIGKRNAKKALAGLRQNDRCSNPTWRNAMPVLLNFGQLQVDIFE
jgi:hypothetical protein